MIRKLLLPLVAVALLGGCVSYGYSSRHGSGDYYYGAPSVEYYYSSPYYYGGPYSYSPYPYYGGGYSYYGGSYGYGYPYGGYYGYYGRRLPVLRWPATPTTTGRGDRRRITLRTARPPWRDLDRLRRSGTGGSRLRRVHAADATTRTAPNREAMAPTSIAAARRMPCTSRRSGARNRARDGFTAGLRPRTAQRQRFPGRQGAQGRKR